MLKLPKTVPVGAIVATSVASVPLLRHFGIVDAGGFVVSLGHEGEVRRQSLADFAVSGECQVVARPRDAAHCGEVLARLESIRSTRYRFISWNCEHFASYCFDGKARSGQVAVGGFATIALGVYLCEKAENKTVGALVGLGGLAMVLFGLSSSPPAQPVNA
ncbi:MAG: lecithin retinol acyltransferase family protein [Tagaea sp.]|nr:lecithin retinol acyltransferase family protein [Tagaea sp.]